MLKARFKANRVGCVWRRQRQRQRQKRLERFKSDHLLRPLAALDLAELTGPAGRWCSESGSAWPPPLLSPPPSPSPSPPWSQPSPSEGPELDLKEASPTSPLDGGTGLACRPADSLEVAASRCQLQQVSHWPPPPLTRLSGFQMASLRPGGSPLATATTGLVAVAKRLSR